MVVKVEKWRGMRNEENEKEGEQLSFFPLSLFSTLLPGPRSRFQPRFGRPRGGDDEGRGNFNQLHLPSSEPWADGHAVPEEGHRPGYGPGAPSHHRPGLWCTELHGKHRRVCTQCLQGGGGRVSLHWISSWLTHRRFFRKLKTSQVMLDVDGLLLLLLLTNMLVFN